MTSHAQATLEGFAAAHEGAERAIAHADRENPPEWRELARGFMAGFISQRAWFTSEDVWLAAEAAGIPKPPDRRSWGGIINGFTTTTKTKTARIRKVGDGFSKLARLHGNHVSVYERI